jgi:hypothetical protein
MRRPHTPSHEAREVRNAKREAVGTTNFKSSSRLPRISTPVSMLKPVTLPPGRARVAASPRASLKEHVGNMVKVMQQQMEGIGRCQDTRGGLGLLIAHLIMPGWNIPRRMPVGIQYSAGTDIGVDGRGDGQRLWDIIDRTFTR